MTTKFSYLLYTLFLISLVTLASPATAQSVTGSGSVSGNITINTTGVFFNVSGSNTGANPLTPGNPNSGSFSGLTNGAIKNLPGLTTPGPLVIKAFATFNTASGTVAFDLQSVAPGTGSSSQCAYGVTGNACTPAGSPFTLIQIAPDAVAIVVTLKGIAYPATAGSGSAGTAMSFTIESATIGTIPGLLPTIVTPTGLHNPYSATLTAP